MGNGSHRVAVTGAVDDFGDNAGVASRGPFLVDGQDQEGRPRLAWGGPKGSVVGAPRRLLLDGKPKNGQQ